MGKHQRCGGKPLRQADRQRVEQDVDCPRLFGAARCTSRDFGSLQHATGHFQVPGQRGLNRLEERLARRVGVERREASSRADE